MNSNNNTNNNNNKDKKQDSDQAVKNNPAEAIDKPEEVQESNDERIDEDFPGYPHYPAEEDILNPDNHTERVDIDVENLTRAHKVTQENLREGSLVSRSGSEKPSPAQDNEEGDLGIVSGTEADVTEEDLLLLGSREQDMDMGDDEEILAKEPHLTEGIVDDLDIPGSELDDENENIGEEDEENNYYSIGGDNHENLEEDNAG